MGWTSLRLLCDFVWNQIRHTERSALRGLLANHTSECDNHDDQKVTNGTEIESFIIFYHLV